MDETLRVASILSVVRKILASPHRGGAYEVLHQQYLTSALEANDKLRRDCTLLDDLEGVGFLTGVFFREVRSLGDRLYPSLPAERHAQEIRAFADHLGVIARKDPAVDVPLRFEGHGIRTVVILIAKAGKLQKEGLQPYIRRIEKEVKAGFDPIFICGWGAEYASAVREIARSARRKGMLVSTRLYEFPISRKKELVTRGTIVVCRISAKYRQREKAILEPVHAALTKHVPEIKSGDVEIVSIARIPGYGSKVAVRFSEDDDHPEQAVTFCLGAEASRLHDIKSELPIDERLRIVKWYPDIKRFAIEALGLEKSLVTSIDLDHENEIIYVTTANFEARGLALGSKGHNVQLAANLLGWDFTISVIDEVS